MSDAELFRRWKSLAGDTSPTPWDEDYAAALFHYFRPHGDGLEGVFEGIECGAELLERLKNVFHCTAERPPTEITSDAYFLVRRPAESSQLGNHLRRHFEKMAEIAKECRCDKLFDVLTNVDRVDEIKGPRPWPPPDDSPEGLLYEVVGDWFRSLEPRKSKALLLKEAYYMVACDYDLARYLMWPLYRESTSIIEPFAPYFELWSRGASFRFEAENTATLYVCQHETQDGGEPRS